MPARSEKSAPFGPVLEPLVLACSFLALMGICVPWHKAHAAIGYEQSTSNTGNNVTSLPKAFNQNTIAGNLIVVSSGWSNTAATAAISDTEGNTYATAVGPVTNIGNFRAQSWYAKNIKGGANTITITYSVQVGNADMEIHEYRGIDPANPLDVTASSVGNSSSPTSGPAITNAANELIFGYAYATSLLSAGSTFNTREAINGDLSEDKIVSVAGSYTATFTIQVSHPWAALMATFIAASPGTQVSSRSDILSDPRPSATSNHTISFTVNTAIYGSSISGSSTLTLALPLVSGFTIPVGIDCGDVDAATSVQFSFNYPGCAATATAWGFSATGSVITLVPPSGTGVYVPTSTQITIKIGSNATQQQQGSHWITNPSTAGIYTISIGGTFGGSGNILVSINSGVTVQATVAESLALTVSSVAAVNCTADDGATVTAIGTSATSVPFGTVSLNTFYIGCQDLVVSTNAGNGYSITTQESSAMKTVNGLFTIPDATCNAGACSESAGAAWTDATKNGLGHTCFNQDNNHDCASAYSNGTQFRQLANIALGETPQTIMSSSTPASVTARIKQRLSVGATQVPGAYTTVITYTIAATY